MPTPLWKPNSSEKRKPLLTKFSKNIMEKFKYKKKLVLFDLDGVLFDTKINMKYSWDLTSKKFNLRI